jgi:hypothetical protein
MLLSFTPRFSQVDDSAENHQKPFKRFPTVTRIPVFTWLKPGENEKGSTFCATPTEGNACNNSKQSSKVNFHGRLLRLSSPLGGSFSESLTIISDA